MAEVVAYRHEGHELVYDTDDVAQFESPRDVADIPCDAAGCSGCGAVHRELRTAHLNITFKPGKQPLWREAAARDDPYARPLPSPVPQHLAEAIRGATWTEMFVVGIPGL